MDNRLFCIMTAIWVVLLSLSSKPTVAMPTCAPSQQAGYVVKIDAAAERIKSPVWLIRQYDRRPLAEGERLCPNDTIENPAGSNRRVDLWLSGRPSLWIEPGQWRRIPKPQFWAAASDLAERLNDYFGHAEEQTPSRTKGAIEDARLFALGSPNFSIVPEWGPLLLAWGEGDESWMLRTGTSQRWTTSPRALVDVKSECPRGCTVEVISRDGREITSVTVEVRRPEDAPWPPWLTRGRLDPAARAALGGWLIRTTDQPEWKAEGIALIASAACDIAAAATETKRLTGFDAAQMCPTIAKQDREAK